MQEEEEASLVHDLGLGKGQRHAHKTGEAFSRSFLTSQTAVAPARH